MENVKEEKRGKGKPRKYKNEEEFLNAFKKYVNHCEVKERLVNIAGFCAFEMISREVYYQCKKYYPYTYKAIENVIEDEALNTKAIGDSMKKHYLNNKFREDYKERQEIELTGDSTIKIEGFNNDYTK